MSTIKNGLILIGKENLSLPNCVSCHLFYLFYVATNFISGGNLYKTSKVMHKQIYDIVTLLPFLNVFDLFPL